MRCCGKDTTKHLLSEARQQSDAEKKQADTFAEKMVTQVIKNLQVTIKNIHIRYEDAFANRARPFAVGVTLHQLLFQVKSLKASCKRVRTLADNRRQLEAADHQG